MAVTIPITVIIDKAVSENSYNGEQRTTKKTPAVTIVAACIRAETGVGPSMASGSQVCRKNCADFPIAPINKKMQISVIRLNSPTIKLIFLSAKSSTDEKTSLKLIDPKK